MSVFDMQLNGRHYLYFLNFTRTTGIYFFSQALDDTLVNSSLLNIFLCFFTKPFSFFNKNKGLGSHPTNQPTILAKQLPWMRIRLLLNMAGRNF